MPKTNRFDRHCWRDNLSHVSADEEQQLKGAKRGGKKADFSGALLLCLTGTAAARVAHPPHAFSQIVFYDFPHSLDFAR